MKKLLAALLVVLMAFCLVACNDSKPVDEPVVDEPVDEPTDEPVGPMAGGWEVYVDETNPQASEEALAAFNKAFEGFAGAGYEPIILAGTQVVAGTNYQFICRETLVTAEPVTKLAVVTIYEDLEGNAEVLNIADLDLGELKDAEINPEETDLLGGWTLNENLVDINLPAEAAKAFDTVTEGLMGAEYHPLALLGTQVVAGTNYAILCLQVTPAAEVTQHLSVLFVYQGVDGETSVLGVTPINMASYN